MAIGCSAASSSTCWRRCAAPTPTARPTFAARRPAASVRCCRRTASAAPICAPLSPKGHRRGLKQRCAAPGRILVASLANTCISGSCGITTRTHPNTGRIITDDEQIFARTAGRRQARAVLRGASGQLGTARGDGGRRTGCRPRWSIACRTTRRWHARSPESARRSWAPDPQPRAGAVGNGRRHSTRGEHLGMLVDQHFSRGVDVTFFGRRCKANPTIARLARQFDCPVVGVRVIRLPDRRFRDCRGRSAHIAAR